MFSLWIINQHENLVYYNPTIKRCSHYGFTELCSYYSKLCHSPKSFIIFPFRCRSPSPWPFPTQTAHAQARIWWRLPALQPAPNPVPPPRATAAGTNCHSPAWQSAAPEAPFDSDEMEMNGRWLATKNGSASWFNILKPLKSVDFFWLTHHLRMVGNG